MDLDHHAGYSFHILGMICLPANSRYVLKSLWARSAAASYPVWASKSAQYPFRHMLACLGLCPIFLFVYAAAF